MTPQQGETWPAQEPAGDARTGAACSAHTLLGEPEQRADRRGGVGDRLTRTDGPAKVSGAFPYSSDLRVPGMLFGATARSPHPSARVRGIDTAAARAHPGVRAVLTHGDLPGERLIGSVLVDQPVLAADRVRHHGEPVAIVAADTPQAARRAAALVAVDYEPLPALTTVEAALADGAPDLQQGVPELAELLAAGPIEETRTYRHAPTAELDPETGVELGLARVVERACAQDVGRAINPLALEGQLEGGSIQGLGLALTEELEIEDGLLRTTGFGEYRIPTIVDAPPVPTIVLELADPETPYGLRGAGEMPSISSTPAVLAALRAATGRPVTHAPARPEDLIADDQEDRG